jgi:hypothetical protein
MKKTKKPKSRLADHSVVLGSYRHTGLTRQEKFAPDPPMKTCM